MTEFIREATKIFKVVSLSAEYEENRVLINAECETQVTRNGWGTEVFTVAKIFKDWKVQGNYTYLKGRDSEKEYKQVKTVINAVWKWVEKVNNGNTNIWAFDLNKILEFTGIVSVERKARAYARFKAEQSSTVPETEEKEMTPAPEETQKLSPGATPTPEKTQESKAAAAAPETNSRIPKHFFKEGTKFYIFPEGERIISGIVKTNKGYYYRVVGSNSVYSHDNIIKYIQEEQQTKDKLAKDKAYHDRAAAEQERERQQAAAEQEKYNNTYGFTDNLTAMQKGKVLKILNKELLWGGSWMTRKDLIYNILIHQYKEYKIILQDDKTIYKILLHDKTVYNPTKTEYEYFLYLINAMSSDDQAAAETEPEQNKQDNNISCTPGAAAAAAAQEVQEVKEAVAAPGAPDKVTAPGDKQTREQKLKLLKKNPNGYLIYIGENCNGFIQDNIYKYHNDELGRVVIYDESNKPHTMGRFSELTTFDLIPYDFKKKCFKI